MGGPTWNFGGGLTYPCHGTERIYNCEMIPEHMTCSLKNPWRCPGVLCSNHTQTNYAPFSLLASIRFHPPVWAGVDISGGEWETVTSAEVSTEPKCRSRLGKGFTIFAESGAGPGVGFLIENRSWSRSENFSFYRSRILILLNLNFLWTASL